MSHKAGNLYKVSVNNDVVIVATPKSGFAQLISLIDGNRHTEAVEVRNINNIMDDEFNLLCGLFGSSVFYPISNVYQELLTD